MTKALEHVRNMCPRLVVGMVVLVRSDGGIFWERNPSVVKVLEGGLGRKACMARGLAEVDTIRAAIESGPARLSSGDLVRRSSQASLGDRWQRTVWRWARAGRVLLRGALVVLRHCEVGGGSC